MTSFRKITVFFIIAMICLASFANASGPGSSSHKNHHRRRIHRNNMARLGAHQGDLILNQNGDNFARADRYARWGGYRAGSFHGSNSGSVNNKLHVSH